MYWLNFAAMARYCIVSVLVAEHHVNNLVVLTAIREYFRLWHKRSGNVGKWNTPLYDIVISC